MIEKKHNKRKGMFSYSATIYSESRSGSDASSS